jgi:anti-sigma B factor antagonist
MKSTINDHGDVKSLVLSGKITIGEGDVQLRALVDQVLDSGARKIILEMDGIKYIDSSGIGELVSCYTTIKNRGGAMRLARLNSKLYSLLQLTALVTVFDIYDTEEDALNGF